MPRHDGLQLDISDRRRELAAAIEHSMDPLSSFFRKLSMPRTIRESAGVRAGVHWLTVAIVLALLAGARSNAGDPTPIGIWLHSNGRVKVEISPCGEALCGSIIWFKWPNDASGLPLVDLKNPNPSLRARPLLGLQVLDGLAPDGKGRWTDGRIYNPDDGFTYHASMMIGEDGTLRVRAYLLWPILGKTFVWTPAR